MNDTDLKKYLEIYTMKNNKIYGIEEDDAIADALDKMIGIVDKPKKKKSSLGPTRAVIDVKQNGYLVTVNGKEYVFNNFDDMSTWMKEHMSPKLDNSDFVDAI